MKTNRPVTLRQEQQHERALCTAILALRSVEECRSFFRDLCTPAELQAMADRWAVVELLERGLPYREIHQQTGVSVTTIGRVARYLTSGNGGYRAVTRTARSCTPQPERRQPMRLKIAVQKSGRLTDSSLELLSRCGLKYSRGKDQLMCYGENMPLDVLFVRDDDIPDLVQEDVCDLGLVGLNVRRGEAPALRGARRRSAVRDGAARWISGAAGCASRCRTASTTADAASLAGKRIATTYPNILGALSRRARHRGRGRRAVGLGRNRAAPRARGFDLRSGLDRLDARRQPSAPGRDRARKPGGADPHAGAHSRRKAGLDAAAVDAHRRRRTGEGQQVHHAACPALGAAGDRQTAARKRGADGDSPRGPRRSRRRARGVPRERLLGNARAAEEAPGRAPCWCCRWRRCSRERARDRCAFSTGNR